MRLGTNETGTLLKVFLQRLMLSVVLSTQSLARHADITKMDEQKLATCIGPTILRAPKTSTELADVAAGLVTKVCSWMEDEITGVCV